MAAEAILGDLELEIDDTTPNVVDGDSAKDLATWIGTHKDKTNQDLITLSLRLGYGNLRATNKTERAMKMITKCFEAFTTAETGEE